MCSLLIAALKASTGAAISYKSVRGDAVTSERSSGLDRPVCWKKFRLVAQIVPVVGASGCWGHHSRTPQAGAGTRKMDSPVLGAGSLRSGCQQGWCLLRTVREGSVPGLSPRLVGDCHPLPCDRRTPAWPVCVQTLLFLQGHQTGWVGIQPEDLGLT